MFKKMTPGRFLAMALHLAVALALASAALYLMEKPAKYPCPKMRFFEGASER